MATKQYNYKNGNTGYGQNSVINNFNNNFNTKPNPLRQQVSDFANRAQRDPWFALGELLGGSWASNYKQRGINKLLDQYQAELNPSATQADKEKALENVAQQNNLNAEQDLALNNGSNVGEFEYLPYDKKIQLAEQYSPKNLNNIAGVGIPTIDGGAELFKNAEQQNKDKTALGRLGYIPTSPTEQAKMALENGAGQLRAVTDKNGKVANVVAQPSADMYEQGIVNERLANIDPTTWINAKVLDMKKKGYSQADIQENLFPLAQQAQAMQDKRDEQMANAYTDLYMDSISKGEYNKANYYGLLMEKYNPARAQYMLNSGVTPYAQYGNNERNNLLDKQYAQKLQGLKYSSDLNLRNRLADYKLQQANGGRGNGAVRSGVSSTQLSAAKEVLAQEKAWADAHIGEEDATNPYKEQADYARKVLVAAMGAQQGNGEGNEQGGGEPKNRTPQAVDYPTLVRQIALYRKDHNGKFDADGLKQLREHYGIAPDNDNPDDTINKYIMSIIGKVDN